MTCWMKVLFLSLTGLCIGKPLLPGLPWNIFGGHAILLFLLVRFKVELTEHVLGLVPVVSHHLYANTF